MAMSVSEDVLDAMLGASAAHREAAEAHFQGIPVPDRASSLLSLLLLLQAQVQSSTPSFRTSEARGLLAAVLLRRDISTLGGSMNSSSESATRTSLLQSMAEPLVSLFHAASTSAACQRQVGHCIAELCLSLSLTGTGESDQVMSAVLTSIGPGCAAADIACLGLLSNLSERAPTTLWKNGTYNGLSSILQQAISSISQPTATSNNKGDGVRCVEAILNAVCRIAIASDLTAKHESHEHSSGNNNNNKGFILSAIQSQIGEGAPKQIDSSSAAAQLGSVCLVPLLKQLVVSLQTSAVGSVDDEVYSKCMQHLSHCATQCPSLLAGTIETLYVLVQTCMMLVREGATIFGVETHYVRLSCLQVLASICEVTDVKRKLLSVPIPSDSSCENNIGNILLLGENVSDIANQNGVIRMCAEFIVQGVDEDVEGWASEPVSLQDDAGSWEDDDVAVYAESLLESFLRNLGGGAHSFPIVLPLVESLFSANTTSVTASDGNWQKQRAALSILEQCLTAAPIAFVSSATVAVEAALQLAGPGSNVRVQYQAIQLIGSMCHADNATSESDDTDPSTDSPGMHIRERFSPRVLEAISQLVQSPCSKVSSHACLAIVSYCRGGNGKEDCGVTVKSTLLVPYLQNVLQALVAGPLSIDLLAPSGTADTGSVTTQSRAIAAVACLANASGSEFAPFYDNIMPGLLRCATFGLTNITPNGVTLVSHSNLPMYELSLLRGSAIVSATIIGQAISDVDDGRYLPDAEKIMQLALGVLQIATRDATYSASIVPLNELLGACARIARSMGNKFAPFVPAVLPHLFNRATEKVDVSVTDGDESAYGSSQIGGVEQDDEEGTESITVALPGMGLKKLILNTSQIEEKVQASRAMYELAHALGISFGPFAEESIRAFLPLLNFKYSADVRSTSALALATMFDSACEYAVEEPASAHRKLPQQVIGLLVQGITQQFPVEDEDDAETLFALADSLSDIFYAAFCHRHSNDGRGVANVTVNDARTAVSLVIQVIGACLGRRQTLINMISSADGTYLDEDEKAECETGLDNESKLLTPLVDSIGFMLKLLGPEFNPVFDQLVAPAFGRLLIGTSDTRARFAAMCLFDDCVEHCGSAAASKYSAKLVEPILHGIDDTKNGQDMDLKQASIYGIAQVARYGPPTAFGSVVAQIIHFLKPVSNEVNTTEKDHMDNAGMVENAVSALASLALFEHAPFAKMKGVDTSSLLTTFLNSLPLREDETEAQICHNGLCDLIDSGMVNVPANAPQLLKIVGDILMFVTDGEEIATPDTCHRLMCILRKMQNEVDSGVMQQGFSSLVPEAQNAIQMAMEHSASHANLVTP